MKLSFNKTKIKKLIKEVFPGSDIIDHKEFETGLVSPTYKIQIKNPKKTLVVKLSKLKRTNSIQTNNKILEYLYEKNLPCPKIYLTKIKDKKIITIMDFVEGKPASEVFKELSLEKKQKFLEDTGKLLRQIHSVAIPKFWNHHNHEINSEKEWVSWTKKRAEKYAQFFKYKLRGEVKDINKKLKDFFDLLEKTKFNLDPLHWDYHLSNINIDSNGRIIGVFDFDNAMKGHNLADIGQTAYWLRFHLGSNEYLKDFLKGYGTISKDDLKLIEGYELLHILAITRTIWFRQKRLGWIIKKHKEILKEILK